MSIRDDLKNFVNDFRVDLFGVAPKSRFANAPETHKPKAILPEVASIVSIGLRIPNGVKYANHSSFETEGMRHAIYIYQMHGYVAINRRLNEIAYEVARYLEDRGHQTTPIPASPPIDNKALCGVFSNRHAAVAAGQAEFGWNTLALTEQFGPRVRWVSILTSAQMEPDPLLDQGLCDHQKCERCVEACPVDAIPHEEKTTLRIGKKNYGYSRIDKERCRTGGTSGLSTGMARQSFELPSNPTGEDYLRALDQESPWQKMERLASMCGRCIIECPVGATDNSRKLK